MHYIKIFVRFPELKETVIFLDKLEGISEEVKGEWKIKINNGIAQVKIGFSAVLKFLQLEYLPHVRTSNIGCSSLPNGLKAYEIALAFHSTSKITPNEVHELGVKEVERIQNRYKDEILKPLEFKDMESFIEHCRTDTTFYKNTEEELINVYLSQTEDIYKVMPNFFNESPKSKMVCI